MNVYAKTGLIAVIASAVITGTICLIPTVFGTHFAAFSNKPVVADATTLPVDGCKDRTVLRIAQSLQNHPEDWKVSKYEIYRGMGWFDGPPLRIWIANEAYGLDFNTDENRFDNQGLNYPFTNECRAYLYSITSHMRDELQMGRLNEATNGL